MRTAANDQDPTGPEVGRPVSAENETPWSCALGRKFCSWRASGLELAIHFSASAFGTTDAALTTRLPNARRGHHEALS